MTNFRHSGLDPESNSKAIPAGQMAGYRLFPV